MQISFMVFQEYGVKRVYKGPAGCMCGCKGKYSTTARMIKKVIKEINEAIANDNVFSFHAHSTMFHIETKEQKYLAIYYTIPEA